MGDGSFFVWMYDWVQSLQWLMVGSILTTSIDSR